jgi:chromate transporter
MSQMVEASSSGERVTLGALFIGFLKVGLCSFGGGLVWVRCLVVDQHQWISEQEFAETLSLCQFMPGPNMANLSVCVGSRLRGPVGAIATVSGFILIPLAIGFSLGALYLEYAHAAVIQKILGGVSPLLRCSLRLGSDC